MKSVLCEESWESACYCLVDRDISRKELFTATARNGFGVEMCKYSTWHSSSCRSYLYEANYNL